MNARAAAAVIGALIATTLIGPAGASAHGLVPVGALETSNVYVPQWAIGGEYGMSPALGRRLDALTAKEARDGHPVKIALIAQAVDMGGDAPTELFGHPTRYAAFLGKIMQTMNVYHGTLLVAMPQGIGVWNPSSTAHPARAAAVHPRMKSEWDIDGLAQAALVATDRLQPSSGAGGRWERLLLGAAVAVALAAAVLAALRLRGQRSIRIRRTASAAGVNGTGSSRS